jgi:hypothetical protein
VLRAHSLAELVRLGTMTGQCASFLEASVVAGLNIVTAGATQAGNITLLIVSERHPTGFPMGDLGGSVVQRVAKERCREPSARDAVVATGMRRSRRAVRAGPVGECCAMG